MIEQFKVYESELLSYKQSVKHETRSSSSITSLDQRTLSILTSRAWEHSLTPIKSLGMNLFMLWMMGDSGIFTLLFLSYALMQAIQITLSVNSSFSSFKGIDVNMQKLVYTIIASGILYWLGSKAGNMGLLPIRIADWRNNLGIVNIV
jgi:Protein of unknown function (DUF1077)